MQAYLGRTLSPWRQDFTALVGQAGEQAAAIYEADYRDFNRDTYARGRRTFDETYAGFKRLLLGAWKRDEEAEVQEPGRPPDGPPPPRPRRPAFAARAFRARNTRPRPRPAAPIARVAADAAGTAAAQELAEAFEAARERAGWSSTSPLDAIAPDHLARDRIPAEDPEMAALRASIRAHGQRTPIEVTPLVDPGRAPCPTACSPAGAGSPR